MMIQKWIIDIYNSVQDKFFIYQSTKSHLLIHKKDDPMNLNAVTPYEFMFNPYFKFAFYFGLWLDPLKYPKHWIVGSSIGLNLLADMATVTNIYLYFDRFRN